MTSTFHFCANADDVPSVAGAYILQIKLAETILIRIAGKPRVELPAGRYLYCGSAYGPGGLKSRLARHMRRGKSVRWHNLYCGSAYGPGGLKSRLARHMRRGKSVRWHIDQLTECGIVTGAWIVCGGRECDLVAKLAPLPAPIPGFGSSDCRRCRSHLLYWPIGLSLSSFPPTAGSDRH